MTVETFQIRYNAWGYCIRDEDGAIVMTGGEYPTEQDAKDAGEFFAH